MTNNEGSEEEIPLDFLDKNKVYLASVYTDGGEKVKTRTQVECSYLLVDASMTMKFDLKPSGGVKWFVLYRWRRKRRRDLKI